MDRKTAERIAIFVAHEIINIWPIDGPYTTEEQVARLTNVVLHASDHYINLEWLPYGIGKAAGWSVERLPGFRPRTIGWVGTLWSGIVISQLGGKTLVSSDLLRDA